MNEKKRTKKSLLETLIILGIVFQGKIKDVINYVKSNYDNEETKECIVYTLRFPHAVIEVGI